MLYLHSHILIPTADCQCCVTLCKVQFLIIKTYSDSFELDFVECEISYVSVSLSNIVLILFSIEEIEGVSLPKKKK